MNLLIVTQKVDRTDHNLGFFHRWVEEFASQAESVIVICLQEGEHNLPNNVRVLSLGKEERESKLQYVTRFLKYISQEVKSYDGVLIHMNPEYALLGGWYWRLMKKKVALWYVHKSVTKKLRSSIAFVDRVFTASPESFRIESDKKVVTGHGIDTEYFLPSARTPSDSLRLLSVGRISRSKNIDVLTDSFALIREEGIDASLTIVGEPITDEDQQYLTDLKRRLQQNNLSSRVTFTGGLPHSEMRNQYCTHDILVHLSETGSIDKVVLEAMSCELPVVSSAESFKDILPKSAVIERNSPDDIVRAIKRIREQKPPVSTLRKYVIEKHGLQNLVNIILQFYSHE